MRNPRSKAPFIQINCAAFPENLVEAELFGYEEGAFTGAGQKGKLGLIELADGGSLFLDEIGDLPYRLQAKLLKYLDDGEVMRIGGTTSRKTDCIIIAATNRDLETLAGDGKFRQDLFFRLNPFTFTIPPLRQRPEDVFGLTYHYLDKYCTEYNLDRRISVTTVAALQRYGFPGNVRELKNIIKKAVVISDEVKIDEVVLDCLGGGQREACYPPGMAGPGKSLKSRLLNYEKSLLEAALKEHNTTRKIAASLGVTHSTIVRKLKQHGLSTPGAKKFQ